MTLPEILDATIWLGLVIVAILAFAAVAERPRGGE